MCIIISYYVHRYSERKKTEVLNLQIYIVVWSMFSYIVT